MPSLFSKIWDRHAVARNDDGDSLLYIDRQLIHEVTSPQAFEGLRQAGRAVRRPATLLAMADHNVPTSADRTHDIADPQSRIQIALLRQNAHASAIAYFDLDDARQGIVHVVGPEQGFIHPGMTVVCGDSHTATLGAFGAIAFGVGTSDVEHALATQTLWLAKPREMRVRIDGRLPPWVGAKDLALAVVARLGAAGGTGYAIEYHGEAIEALSMEQRMTICNMTIEAGRASAWWRPTRPPSTTCAAWRTRRARRTGTRRSPTGAAWRPTRTRATIAN